MEQFLKITNKGLICEEDLMLIGSSTKRDDNTKIGMFGSGWKYALAWLIRNDCTPKIFSGDRNIHIDYRPSLHRNNPVRIITVNNKDTSLTAEMGPQWTGWMAIREIVSNAIDEGNYQLSTEFSPEFKGTDDTTTVYIPMIKELREMMMFYDRYFGFEREAAATNKFGSIYIKSELTEQTIYRKGIRCYDRGDKSCLDYNFTDIRINESRLSDHYAVKNAIKNIIGGGNMTPAIIAGFAIDMNGEEDYIPSMNSNISDCLVALAKDGKTFTTHAMRNLLGHVAGSSDSLIVSSGWYAELVRLGYAKSMLSFLDGTDIPFVQTNSRDTSMISHYLMKVNINLEVVTGKFESYKQVIVAGNKAVIHDNCAADDMSIAAEVLNAISARQWSTILGG
jgi:hypothetical protein